MSAQMMADSEPPPQPMSSYEIARAMGLSHTKVDQIIKGALAKLQRNWARMEVRAEAKLRKHKPR